MTMKPDLMMKLLLAAVGLLLGLNLVASTAGPALAARDDLYAWHTLPTAWLNDSDGTFQVNEQSTLAVTIVVLLAIALWETWDTFYKASRAH